MTPKTDSGSSPPEATTSGQSSQIVSVGSKHQFDTFETKFFQQGDDESVGVAVEVERFDDLEELAKHKKLAPSRQFMMGVGVGSTCIAIIGCLALWRSSGHSHAAPSAIVDPPVLAEPVLAPSAAGAPPAQAEPALANSGAVAPSEPAPANSGAVAPSEQVPAQPTPGNPLAAAASAQAEPALAPAPSPPAAGEGVAVPVPTPAPTAAPALAQQAPAVAEKPSPTVAAPEPAKAVAEEKPLPAAPAVAADASEAQGRCKNAISGKRNKEILAVCPDAFAADSSAADIAVALAKIEFDRGRPAQASDWGRKALAADPNAADAYVFIGGAEQSAGHRKAAKEAYKRYLQLAPGGRYARDLRAIVGSL
jgi:hypothetical protein